MNDKTLHKFIKCDCGKKKKINWIGKAEYLRGEYSFCTGITQCPKCGIIQEHYSGNFADIQLFIQMKQESNH